MTFEDKAEIVITQLRADRDRLLDAFGKIISEATSLKISYTDHDKDTYRRGVNDVLRIIDKYKAESENEE